MLKFRVSPLSMEEKPRGLYKWDFIVVVYAYNKNNNENQIFSIFLTVDMDYFSLLSNHSSDSCI